jgi:periplasmic divalent cation tolerance protein
MGRGRRGKGCSRRTSDVERMDVGRANVDRWQWTEDSQQQGLSMSGKPEDAGAFLVVFVTAPDAETASAIGTALVEERLAACANLVPGLTSIYRWEGRIHKDSEVLMLIKTRAEHFPALEARVRAMHPYKVPEIVALRIDSGSAPYLRWIGEETGPEGGAS